MHKSNAQKATECYNLDKTRDGPRVVTKSLKWSVRKRRRRNYGSTDSKSSK